MSELIFPKGCYTARSSGYKYRTLSTNTGERKKRDSKDDNVFEKKFKELSKAISTRVNQEVDNTNKARESIQGKFAKLDAKITSMVELQKTMTELHKNLDDVNLIIVDMIEKVNKIEKINSLADISPRSHMTTFRSADPIVEECEDRVSVGTHV